MRTFFSMRFFLRTLTWYLLLLLAFSRWYLEFNVSIFENHTFVSSDHYGKNWWPKAVIKTLRAFLPFFIWKFSCHANLLRSIPSDSLRLIRRLGMFREYKYSYFKSVTRVSINVMQKERNTHNCTKASIIRLIWLLFYYRYLCNTFTISFTLMESIHFEWHKATPEVQEKCSVARDRNKSRLQLCPNVWYRDTSWMSLFLE